MGLAYPVAPYRGGQRPNSAAGSQSSGRVPGRPANDNWPRTPRPANDNIPRAPATAFARRTALRGAFRALGRAVPYLGLALLGYEVWQAFRDSALTGAVKLDGSWSECIKCNPNAASIEGYTGNALGTCQTAICTTLEALPYDLDVPFGAKSAIDPNWGALFHWKRNSDAPTTRWSLKGHWARPNANKGTTEQPHYATPAQEPFPDPYTVGDPAYSPAPLAPPVPLLPPGVDPLIRPPFSNEPLPVPLPWRAIPYRVPNPARDPREQPRRGPGPRPRPRLPTERDPMAPPVAGEPGPTIVVGPGTVTEGNPAPGARPHPPRRGEKEKKVRSGLPFLIRHPVNAATEAKDFIDAVWEAIPWKDRIAYHEGKKVPRADQKARALYDLFDKIDWEEAIENIVENQIEDFVFGKAGQLSKKSRETAQDFVPNSGRGWQSGPWDTPPLPTSTHW